MRFLFIAFALAMANPSASQEAGQTPQIQAEQQSDAAAKSQSQRGEQGSRPVDVAPVGEQHASEDAKRKADSDAEKRAEEAREYWPFYILGARLKVTDSLLALFTFLLILVGAVQGYFLYRTDQGMRKAARAALLNAEALISAEQARLFVGIKSETISRIVSGAGFFDNSPSMFNDVTESPGVGYFFNNYGKTAAILKEVRDFMTIADAFPDRYDLNIRNLPDELLIQPGKESAIFLTQCKPFTVGDAVAFQKKGKPIWLYGYVRFADAFGQEAVLRFRYQYQRGFGGLRLVWYEETPRTRPNEDRE